jgi:hypothetical protein
MNFKTFGCSFQEEKFYEFQDLWLLFSKKKNSRNFQDYALRTSMDFGYSFQDAIILIELQGSLWLL